MLIKSLTLRYFRNYGETTIRFAAGGAYITGANGSGKTNFLEAIYYLANQFSFRTSRREELQGWDAEACMIGATVVERESQRQSDLAVRLWRGGRRLYLNGKETRDLRRFTVQFAAVAFHPGTMHVVKGGPAGRRQLVDRGIVSLQPEFARVNQDLYRALKQRNALMRSLAHDTSTTLVTWTERFVDLAARLTRYRQQYITQLNKTLVELVACLGEDIGTLTLNYQPAVLSKCSVQERQEILTADDSEVLLHQRFRNEAQRLGPAEKATGQTLFGPQRDDIVIRYRNKESRGFASQGEQRLAAFLLVAALAIDIHRQHGYRPVVLLDDIVSELDERNRMVVFDFLNTHAFQVFITDVEERPLYRNLSPLTPLRVRQTNGRAELRHPDDTAANPPNAVLAEAEDV
ncbi:DNA replication and repair protein RecF [Candidatus Entotheonellaceae bacterium PAL068K]